MKVCLKNLTLMNDNEDSARLAFFDLIWTIADKLTTPEWLQLYSDIHK